MGYFDDISSEELRNVTEYLRRQEDKPKVADKPWYNDAYEVGRQIAAGFVVDAPRMVGQAIRWVSPDGSVMDEAGRSAVDAADARAPGWEPDMQGRGLLAGAGIKGGRAIGPMIGAIGATLAGGPVAGGAVAAAQFGMGAAQDTEDKLLNEGKPYEDANAAARRVGLIQGPLEGVATAVGGWALKGAAPLLGLGAQTTGSVAARMTDTAVLKPLAKGMGLNLLAQPATEVAQDVSTEFVERSYGAKPQDAWEIAKDSAQGAVGLTLLLGPFAAGGSIRRAQRAEQLKQALYNPNTPDAVRAQARDMVVQAAATEGVAPENADAWLDEQFQADDARTAEEQAYIQRRAQQLYDAQPEALRRQNQRDLLEIRSLMEDRQPASPLGEVAPSATAGAVAPESVTTVMQAQQAAQQEREVAALAAQQAAAQAQQQKSPEQLAKEQAQAETLMLNQQAMAIAKQEGVAETKGAPQVIKEMLRATDMIGPEVSGQVLGELQAGDVQSARQVLTKAIRARQKAEADMAKEEQKQAEFEAKLAAADAKRTNKESANATPAPKQTAAAAAVPGPTPSPAVETTGVATQGPTPNVPTTAQPGTQASQAQSAQGEATGAVSAVVQPASVANIDPNKQIAVGRKGREKQVTAVELSDMIKGASIVEQRRIARAMGWDVAENPTTGAPMLVELNSPMSFAEIGRQEETETGKKVSRQAIQQSLQKFGIDPQMVDQATSSDWGNTSVTDEELGIGRVDDSGADSSGLRVEKSASKAMGQGLVNDGTRMTVAQRNAYDEATRLLKEAGMGSDVALSEDPRTMEQLDGTVVSDLRELNPAKIQQNIRTLLNDVDAPNAQADWDDGRIMWGDLPDTLKADWIDLYKVNIAEHEDNYEQFAERLSRDQRSVEADFVQLAARKPTNTPGAEAITGNPGSNAGSDGVARIQGPVAGEVARDGSQADAGQEVVVGDGTKSAATVVTKKKRRVAQPIEDVEVKGARFNRSEVSDHTQTESFKRWFGDSKVVDADGKPLVVYHGTPAKGESYLWGGNEPFFVFDKGKLGSNTKAASATQGFFFGNLINAAHYAGGGGMGNLTAFVEDIAYADKRMAELDPKSYSWEVQSKRKAHAERVLQSMVDSGRLMPVYLSLQNPLVHDFGAAGYRDTTYAELLESAKREGRDGAIFKNTADPYEGDIFVVFEPTQIKSAIGNRGTFDPANPDIRFAKGDTTLPGQFDKAGAPVGIVSKTLEDLERTPSVKETLDSYRKRDLGHVLDTVQDWFTTSSRVDWSGAYTTIDGRPTMVLPVRTLLFPSMVEQTVHHELGHAVDLVEEGGLFSGMPEFNLRIVGDKVRAHGDVANELVQHYQDAPDSPLSKLLKYPLDRTKYGDLDAQAIREELFAQLWSSWNTPTGRDFITENLPDTTYFMEKVDDEIRQDEFRTKVNTIAANGRTSGGAGGQTRFNRQEGTVLPTAATRGDGGPSVLQGRAGSGQQRVSAPTALARSPKVGTVQRNIAKLPKVAQGPVRNGLATIGDWANKGLDRVVFTGDLIDRAAKAGLTSAKTLERILAKRGNVAREMEREVERIADMYALVPESDRGDGPKSLNQFLFDSTRTGKWGYGKDADIEMEMRFNALKPESQALVRAIFDHGDKVLAQKKKAVLEHTASEYDALIDYGRKNPGSMSEKELATLVKDKQADLARFKTLFALREGKPYAPIKRMGPYAVIAKSPEYRAAQEAGDTAEMRKLEQDADHYHVSFVESKNEGRNLMDRLLQQGFFGLDSAAVELVERDRFSEDLYGGDSMLSALTKIRSRIDSQVADGDKSAVKMRTLVSEMYLEALAEGSARKSEMRRRGVAGEVDMLRSFATQGRADAQFMASVESNPQVQETIQQMRLQSRRGGDTTRKSELYNELLARYMQTLEVDRSPLLNKLTRLTSIWFLATSPGYYLQNLTQPWMMSVPAMAGAHGYTKASGALWTAYSELGPVMKSAKLFSQQFNFDEVPADVREAVKELANRGRIDIGLETEMGEFKVGGDGALSDGWNKIDKGMRLAVQKVESVNRLSTAMAAYRLALSDGKTHEQAVDYADRILTDTHGNYDRFSAPRAFNTKTGKVMLQFRKFQLVQLSFYGKLIRDTYQGNERAVALKTLAYSLLHTGAMAGVMGLPGYAAVAAILGMFGGDDDKKFDLTHQLRKFIGDEHLATLILRGAPTLGGSGVDLSGKIGSGNMLSVMPFSNADVTTTTGFYEAAGTLLGGASVGLMARVADGIGLMSSGDWYKGIERTMPKGISDAMAAYRTYNDGMTRRNGDVILPAEDVSEVEGLIKLLGFAPAEQSVVYEKRDVAFKTDEQFKDRSTRIKNDYIKAVKAGDAEARTKAMDAWLKLQVTRRETGYKTQPMSELIKAPLEQAKRERNTVGGVQFNRTNREFAKDLAGE